MIPILWVIITVSFFVMRLTPGGPFDAEKPVPIEIKRNLEAKYNMHLPLWHQYLLYLKDIVQGDLGPSFQNKDYTVNDIIASTLPTSLELGFYAILFASIFGILLGILAALNRNRFPDYFMSGISVLGLSVPNMVLGPILVMVFAITFDWLPTSGWDQPSTKILPSFTLGMAQLAVISRLMRSGMIDVLSKPFIRTAQSKGLKNRVVIARHCLRAAILPVVSYMGPAIAFVVTGSVVIEQIFAIPGMGRYFVISALNRDYTVVLGVSIVLSAFILFLNLFVDMVYFWLDPRMRESKS
jgi:oligopeptide transport system permease protein